MGDALSDIAAERRRQVEAKGWTSEHDDHHQLGELALAAATYAAQAAALTDGTVVIGECALRLWPWNICDLPAGDRRDLMVKAGALIVAELDRLDRAAGVPGPERPPRPDLALGACLVAAAARELSTAQAFAQTAVDFLRGEYEPLEQDADDE